MKKLLAVTALATVTAGCSPDPIGSRGVDPEAFRSFALSQITLYNELGIDPLQADPRTLALMVALCGTAGSLSASLAPAGSGRGDTILAFCAVVARAAAPAA